MMGVVNSGFSGRSRPDERRLPPGQTLADDWPVLTAGPTEDIDEREWSFTLTTESRVEHRWDWAALLEMGVEDIVTDIHCVTHWSKLDMPWRGVPVERLFEDVDTAYDYVMVESYGGYTTNLSLDDLFDGQAWIAIEAEGEPLTAEHGGPARLLVPHLYFWKSAKWVSGMRMLPSDEPGFWEQNGYHLRGDPWLEERCRRIGRGAPVRDGGGTRARDRGFRVPTPVLRPSSARHLLREGARRLVADAGRHRAHPRGTSGVPPAREADPGCARGGHLPGRT
jgi:DMSO/TMAO reductase YedYZ molybdopterin-dependent catalytic subunit